METPPYIEFKFFKSVENISFEEVQAKRMGRAMQWFSVQMSCFKIVCGQLNRQFSLLLKGQSIFIAVYNIPLNIQKRNEQSIKEGSWLFKYSLEHAEREWTVYNKKGQARFFLEFFFVKILSSKALLWPPGDVLVVLQYSEECSSAFLTQKIFENQYCVGPTYTNFSRNRASVSRLSWKSF